MGSTQHHKEPLEWGTFHGTKILFNELSHQHISNITYYFKLVLNMKPHPDIYKEIEDRFGGIILPYKPLLSFPYEINALKRKGYTTGEVNADVIVDGKWVGKIEYK